MLAERHKDTASALNSTPVEFNRSQQVKVQSWGKQSTNVPVKTLYAYFHEIRTQLVDFVNIGRCRLYYTSSRMMTQVISEGGLANRFVEWLHT